MDARRLGLSGAEFWQLRLRELWLELEAGQQRERRAYERDVTHAWFVEYMARQKELSGQTLAKLLRRPGERQTLDEQRAVVEQIRAHFGWKYEFRPAA